MISNALSSSSRWVRTNSASQLLSTRRATSWRTGIAVEARGVNYAGRLGRHLSEPAHPLVTVVEPPGRTEAQAGTSADQRGEFARVGRIVQREEDQPKLRAMPTASSKGRYAWGNSTEWGISKPRSGT